MKTIADLDGTKWSGKAELHLDPLGNETQLSDCTLHVDAGQIAYTWSHEGKPKQGSITLTDGGARFTDSFHSPEPMGFTTQPGESARWALLHVFGTYPAGDGPPWGWRISLCHREPTGELVLQMTNIAPWGEETRAVRMTLTKAQ